MESQSISGNGKVCMWITCKNTQLVLMERLHIHRRSVNIGQVRAEHYSAYGPYATCNGRQSAGPSGHCHLGVVRWCQLLYLQLVVGQLIVQ